MDNLDSANQDALNYYLLGEELAFIAIASEVRTQQERERSL
jgi:hypothetical protein